MVFIPRIPFKTGILPSVLRTFPPNGQYTGTQKLMLTSTRIFGTKIGYFNIDVEEYCVRAFLPLGS